MPHSIRSGGGPAFCDVFPGVSAIMHLPAPAARWLIVYQAGAGHGVSGRSDSVEALSTGAEDSSTGRKWCYPARRAGLTLKVAALL